MLGIDPGRMAKRKLLASLARLTKPLPYTSRHTITLPMMYFYDLQCRPCPSVSLKVLKTR
jgi:hypothetical protein